MLKYGDKVIYVGKTVDWPYSTPLVAGLVGTVDNSPNARDGEVRVRWEIVHDDEYTEVTWWLMLNEVQKAKRVSKNLPGKKDEGRR